MSIIRPLSAELQLKAIRELNEVPNRINDDIQQIKDWLKKQSHLIAKQDDQTLLTFLRSCKFSIQRTKEKLDYFYTMKTLVPEFFSNKDPMLPEIQDILQRGIFVPFPKPTAPDGPTILLYRWGNADSERNHPKNLAKTLLMIVEILLKENDNFLIAGHQSLIDLQDLPFGYMTQVSPAFFKKVVLCGQNACPLRIKEMNFLNVPYFFETLLNMITQFASEKLKNRLVFYGKDYRNELHENIPPSVLPKDYGGEEESVDILAEKWKMKMESYREWFLNDDQYYSDESKRQGRPRTSSDVFGVAGSFRKLQID